MGSYFLLRLQELHVKHPLIGEVRGLGMFIGIELVRDRGTLEPATHEANYVIAQLKKMKILVSTDGPFDNVLKIKPPLCFSKENADTVCEALDHTLSLLKGRLVSHDGVVCYGDSLVTQQKPNLQASEIPQFAADIFGIETSEVTELPSYDDQNFLLKPRDPTGPAYVLKISHSLENTGLDLLLFNLHTPNPSLSLTIITNPFQTISSFRS